MIREFEFCASACHIHLIGQTSLKAALLQLQRFSTQRDGFLQNMPLSIQRCREEVATHDLGSDDEALGCQLFLSGVFSRLGSLKATPDAAPEIQLIVQSQKTLIPVTLK